MILLTSKLLFRKQIYFVLLHWYKSAVSVVANLILLNKSFSIALPPDSVGHLLSTYVARFRTQLVRSTLLLSSWYIF